MSNNPKSLASLADELENQTIVVSLEMTRLEVRRTKEAMWAAAAALRAPTIAADDAEAADADSVEYANKVQSNLSRPDAFVWMIARNAYLAGRAALATPSPTIAAPSPSNEVTTEAARKIWRGIRELGYDDLAEWAEVPLPDRGALVCIIEAALNARKPADDGAGQ